MKRLTLLSLLLFFSVILTFAQKPALNHSVYDSWKSLRGITVPQNGEILLYSIVPGEGDALLVIENIHTGKRIEVPRGSRPKLSKDGKKVVTVIKPLYSQTRQAKINRSSRSSIPKDTLAIVDITTGEIKKYANYKSYYYPNNLHNHIAFEPSVPKERADETNKAKNGAELYVLNISTMQIDTLYNASACRFNKNGDLFVYVHENKCKDIDKKYAKELHVLHTESMQIDTLRGGASFTFDFDKEGKHIAYIVEPSKKDSTGTVCMMLYNSHTRSEKQVICAPKGAKIKLPVYSTNGKLAFKANTDTSKTGKLNVGIYLYDICSGETTLAAHNKMDGLQQGWIISEAGNIDFSKDGQRLFFGISSKPREKDPSLIESEQPELDIWSWHDDYLQTVQLKYRSRQINQTYTSYINTSLPYKLVQLGDEQVPSITIPGNGNADYTLIFDDKKYRIETQWNYNYKSDVYLVDIKDGSRKLLKEGVCYSEKSNSPDGKYTILYDKEKRCWLQYTYATGEFKNLTEGLGVAFHKEEYDMPGHPSPYGKTIWFANSEAFLINDKYDYWQFDPTGAEKPHTLTDNYGRTNNTRLTIERIMDEPESEFTMFGNEKTLKDNEAVHFSTFNFKTKETGFAVKNITKKKSTLQKLVEGPYTYESFTYCKPGKGKKAGYIFARGNYEDGKNAFITFDNFKTQKQLTDINPQQREYNWGTVELVNWQTADNIFCEGLLFKPENLDTTGKYPVMIYFYEKNSESLYLSRNPAPSRSSINIPYFVSNGYVVFVPDVYFKEGEPGQSAMRSIMPGIQMLEETYPWIDGNRIGIQGHSWGGYQAAYMITQTDKFKAAATGAPVANMTSAYGGIRWGSGSVRHAQYEQGQCRIGKDLWSGYDMYYRNSPLFFIPDVTTPVLIMHNDQDEAVPWYQGIEFFTALRRCGKVAWMLQYNEEEHHLLKRKNTKDLSIRLSQFFDHYLKGAPMPKWMKYGRPAVDKGYDLGYDLVK